MAIKVGLDRKPTAAERRDAKAIEDAEKRAERAERALDVCFGGKWSSEESKLQRLADVVSNAHDRFVTAQEVLAGAKTATEAELAVRKVGEASAALSTALSNYHHHAEQIRIERIRRKVTTEPGGIAHDART